MATPFLAEIKMFGGNFAIRNYAFCNGQLLSIAQNTAVFALLGTTYGGNGQTTFGLPNMQGRSPVHWGTGAGLSNIQLGQAGGTETATLTTSNLPVHTHTVAPLASTATGTASSPAGAIPAVSSTRGESAFAAVGSSNATLAATTSSATGGGQAFAIRSPYLGVSFIIALQGIFPSRS